MRIFVCPCWRGQSIRGRGRPFTSWAQTRWPEAKANAWYATQPWLVGNYIPRSAINQLEMWQEATFDPVQIDKELA